MHKAAAHAKRGLPLRHLPAMDLPFLVLVLTLVGFGLVMLGSASSAVALYRRGDAFAYLRPQLLYAAMGIGAMWAASRVDYHVYHKLAWPLLAPSLVLLDGGAVHAGVQRLQALAGASGAGYSAAQRDRQICGGAGVCAHHLPQPQPHGELCGGGAALCTGAGSGGCAHAAGTAPLRHRAHSRHRRGAHVRRRHRPQVVHAGRGGRCSGHWRPSSLCRTLCPTPPTVSTPGWTPFADPLGDGHQTIQSLYAIGSGGAAGRAGPGQQPPEASVRARAPERFYFFHRLRGAGLCGGLRRGGAVRAAALAGNHAGGPCARIVSGRCWWSAYSAGGPAGRC